MKLLKVHEDFELRQRRGQQLSIAAEDVSSDGLDDYVVPFYAVCHLHPVVPFGRHDISRLDKHAEGDDGHQHTDDTADIHDQKRADEHEEPYLPSDERGVEDVSTQDLLQGEETRLRCLVLSGLLFDDLFQRGKAFCRFVLTFVGVFGGLSVWLFRLVSGFLGFCLVVRRSPQNVL